MSIRRRIIDYSRGNNLHCFWLLYRLQKKTGEGFMHDVLTFMMSRCAHRHGGYIGPDTVIKGNLTLPHGLHGIFISRYAEIGENIVELVKQIGKTTPFPNPDTPIIVV